MIDLKQRAEQLSSHGQAMSALSTMSLTELMHSLFRNLFQLVTAEAELVRTEVQSQLIGEVMLTRRIIIGAAILMLGLGMLLTSIFLALSWIIPAWLSAGLCGILFTALGVCTLVLAWRRQKSLAQVEAELKERLLWSSKAKS